LHFWELCIKVAELVGVDLTTLSGGVVSVFNFLF